LGENSRIFAHFIFADWLRVVRLLRLFAIEAKQRRGCAMTKRRRRALIWVGCCFAIVAIALTVFVATLDQNRAKQYISAGVSKATGRQLSINGDLKLDLGWISRLSASEI